MKKFVKLDNYGQLYIDKVLFESYFPIIFTCLNDNSEIFISVCCQSNEKGCKWLLGKTNGESIVRMLQDEITIRQLLLEHSSAKISVNFVGNNYMVAYNNSDWDVDSPYLPKIDSYMYAEDGEFKDEIDYFLSLNHGIRYNAEYYKSVAEALGTISKGIEPVAEAFSELTSAIETITIRSEVVNTLKVFGKLYSNLMGNSEKYINREEYESVYDKAFDVVSENLSLKVEVEDNNNFYVDAA